MYEARQNKEKVSRRIEGGKTRQKIIQHTSKVNSFLLNRIRNGKVLYRTGADEFAIARDVLHYNINPYSIIQRVVANAQIFRNIAFNISTFTPAFGGNRTVGISNTHFAITPILRNAFKQQIATIISGNRIYAGPVPNGNRVGNHAERKLIFHNAALQEIGVDRNICQTCINAICANNNIQHVSDPRATFQVTPNALIAVAP